MRILHTSDWHVGRTFFRHDTVPAARDVLGALGALVTEHEVDVVVIAGDVFDLVMPAAAHFDALTEALEAIVRAGAHVVLTSGNHDSPARLGFQAGFARAAGVHAITRFDAASPVLLPDAHGDVAFYGIPFLEPVVVRAREGSVRSHDDAIGWAMDAVRADIAARGTRSVVLAHCFAAGVPAGDSERDLSAGGLDVVDLARFDGPDYVALGHIHSAATLSPRVRYSGAPLHFSFAEAGRERGAWLVDLGAEGLEHVSWVGVPVPRALVVLEGELDALLADASLREHEASWVLARLTDRVRPIDAMRRMQARFPHTAAIEHRPPEREEPSLAYAERIAARSDVEIGDAFLAHVRGVGASDAERDALRDAFDAIAADEAAR